MSALYYLAPQFLLENRLCWLRTPLYIVTSGGKESYYFDDNEYNAAAPKGVVVRAKGLGALSEQQARCSMFSSEFQRMDILSPNDESLLLLAQLMGEDVQPRTDFIFKNVDFSTIKE